MTEVANIAVFLAPEMEVGIAWERINGCVDSKLHHVLVEMNWDSQKLEGVIFNCGNTLPTSSSLLMLRAALMHFGLLMCPLQPVLHQIKQMLATNR